MISLEEFRDIRAKLDRIRQKADRAKGALEQLGKQLKSDFGCDSLDKLKEEVKRSAEEYGEEEETYREELQKFRAKYDNLMGE